MFEAILLEKASLCVWSLHCGCRVFLQIIVCPWGKQLLWQLNLSSCYPFSPLTSLSPLQLMSAVKKGQVSDSRLAILMKTAEETLEKRGPVTVDRSGGGVWRGKERWHKKLSGSQANHAIWMTMLQSSRGGGGGVWPNQVQGSTSERVRGETVSNESGGLLSSTDAAQCFILYFKQAFDILLITLFL